MTDSSKPIFLFGVGRCGSTFQQVQLSNLSDVWIWGEHGGMLVGFFDWIDQVKSHPLLNEYVFSQDHGDLRKFIRPPFENSTLAAWLNGFGPADLKSAERALVSGLMSKALPVGKTRWGFKEINYGIDDNVPERLLQLFAGAKIVHTVRDPFRTVESSVFAWAQPHLKEAVDALDYDAVDQLYYYYLRRWASLVMYFHALDQRYPGRIITSHLETFHAERSRLLEFLSIEDDSPNPESDLAINVGSAITDPDNAEYVNVLVARRSKFAQVVREAASLAGYALPF